MKNTSRIIGEFPGNKQIGTCMKILLMAKCTMQVILLGHQDYTESLYIIVFILYFILFFLQV